MHIGPGAVESVQPSRRYRCCSPRPDHGLEPTRRDDAGVHIDPGVRVDKGLITFHHERLEERDGHKRGGHTLDEVDGVLPSPPFQDVAVGGLGDLASASHRRVEPSISVNKNVTTPEEQPPGQRTPPQNLTTDTLLPGTSPESDQGVSPKHTQRQRATSNASSMSSSSTCTDRSTSRIPSAMLVIPSVPTASVPAPIIVGAIPTTRRSTSVSVPAARSRAGAAGRSTPRGLGGTTLQRRGGRSGAGRPSSRCPRRRVRHRTPPAARAPVQHRFGCCGGRLTQPIFTRKCAQMCSRDADQHRSQSTKTAVELHI